MGRLRSVRSLAWFVLLAACGRAGFEPRVRSDAPLDAADDAPVVPDASIDAPPPANRVFATSGTYPGNLGGLAGADAKCAAAATAGGLPGTFVAFLSTSTFDARDRLAGSRGWVRVDGAPVADTVASMLAGVVFNPIDLDEAGTRFAGLADTWTGSQATGVVLPGAACADWTVTTGSGQMGYAHYGPPAGVAFSTFPCATAYHLYCFEVGHTTPVAPTRSATRFAFVSSPRTSPGLAALDTLCQQEATAASLPGTYRAAVATTTTTIAARFTGTDWQRPDGTPVSVAGNALFDPIDQRSFIHQKADGTYLVGPTVFTGATGPSVVGTPALTCNDWVDVTTAAITAGGGKPSLLHNGYMWGLQSLACNSAAAVICLQE